MHLSTLSTVFLVWLQISASFAAPAVGVAQQEDEGLTILEPRQQKPTTTALGTIETSAAPTTTTTAATITTTTAAATAGGNTASNTDASISKPTTTVPSLNAAATSTSQDGQKANMSTYSGGLPIHPEITPALGVAGMMLLLLGGTLALIGVRNQWVQIFFSTAFVMALGVTVLIVYVMSPPVSNAVQGGYLVAVFFTGITFGGLALVFREITEGLGCLLGGFCIGMWFLTLKSGGLVTSNGPKIGLILAFTVGCYCLSFSRYTRPYGLIVCTAFSGATALALGIDCYSRAGLKEFWLYIWDLNKRMFPLHTYTYPVTRDIRVEQAVIIIITAMGVISQLRLWRVIQERRAKEENSRKEKEKKKDAEEQEIGRRLEEYNNKERAEWEHMYGSRRDGKSPSVSETAVGEGSRRGSGGFQRSDHDKDDQENRIEMKDMNNTDLSPEPSDSEKNREPGDDETPDTSVGDGSGTCHERECDVDQKSPEAVTTAIMPHFEDMLRAQTALHDDDDDDSEHGAVVGSDAGTFRSKRLSGTSLLNRLSWRSSNGAKLTSQTQSEEALVAPEDSNSSVMGVVDELGEPSSGCPSISSEAQDEAAEEKDQQILISSDDAAQNTQAISKRRTNHCHECADAAVDTNTDTTDHVKQPVRDAAEDEKEPREHWVNEAIPSSGSSEQKTILPAKEHEADASESPIQDVADTKMPEETMPRHVEELTGRDAEIAVPQGTQEAQSAGREAENDHIAASGPKFAQQDEKPRLNSSTVKCIPEQTSKIVHSYRTQEWAKHLEDAEPLELEPIQQEDGSPEHSTEGRERTAPVEVTQLLQTPFNAQPPPAVTRSVSPEKSAMSPDRTGPASNVSPTPPHEVPRSKSRNSVRSVTIAQSPPSRASSAALANMPRSSSHSLAPEQGQGVVSLRRSTSTPLVTITGPGDGNGTKSPRRSGPPPLLAVRESMVRNRLSSTSLRHDPWAPRCPSRISMAEPFASPTFSIPEEREEEDGYTHEDEDDVPLSKRRAMLQRQTMNSPSTVSLQSLEPARPPPSPSRAVDSSRSAAVMAAWRQSVREDISQRRDPLAFGSSSSSLGSSVDRPLSLWGSMQQMRDASATQVDSEIANGMQRGSMNDLHRQAMRRMQASVNRQL